MRLLLDGHWRKVTDLKVRDIAAGQLLTPLTRYKNWNGFFAVDNGAFTGFQEREFLSLLKRNEDKKEVCLFVACPDVVGSGRRTLELWRHRDRWIKHWPGALVAQDGIEDLDIPWHEMSAVFIGGSTEWKLSKAAADVVRTAKTLGKHTHIGRVNTPERWQKFMEMGADTCDGSGLARYDWMIDAIEEYLKGERGKLHNTPDLPFAEDSEEAA